MKIEKVKIVDFTRPHTLCIRMYTPYVLYVRVRSLDKSRRFVVYNKVRIFILVFRRDIE